MDLLSLSTSGIAGFFSVIVPFLLVLTVIVFVHEMGHFLVARWCGVKVDVFAVGFGRRIASFTQPHHQPDQGNAAEQQKQAHRNEVGMRVHFTVSPVLMMRARTPLK